MAEATDENHVVFQPEELKFPFKCAEGECSSSLKRSVKITNRTDQPVGFKVETADPDNYEGKPRIGIVQPFENRYITFTARKLLPVEQRVGEIPVQTFFVSPDCREKDIAQVCPEKSYHPPRGYAIPCHAFQERVIRVRSVHPKEEIATLMNKVADEVCEENLGPAQEILREVIELHPSGFSHLTSALVNHRLDRKEEVKRHLQEAERLLAEETGEHFDTSALYRIISDRVGVPTYTSEKLSGKQFRVEWSVAVTENQFQRFECELCLTPTAVLSSEGHVELTVRLDCTWFKVVKSQTTDSHPDHFIQSFQIVVRPTGKWSESFPSGFGCIKCSPGNELNTLSVQQGISFGFSAGMNVGASPSGAIQLNTNNTSGTTSLAYGFKSSGRDGHACVWEWELRAWADGSKLDLEKRYYTIPEIPEDVKGGVNYPNLGEAAFYVGKWLVTEEIAMNLRDDLEFTISLKAKLPAVRRCRKSSPTHLFKPPKPELVVREEKFDRICVFAIAGLKRFIGKSTRQTSLEQ